MRSQFERCLKNNWGRFNVPKTTACIFAVALTAGCIRSDPSQHVIATATKDSGPSHAVWFDVPKNGARKVYLSALVSRTGGLHPSSGNLVSARFRVRDARGSGGSSQKLQAVDQNLTAYLAHTYSPQTPPELLFKLGRQVALQTVCQGRSVGQPTGTRFNGAAAKKVYRANAGRGLANLSVPAGVSGGAIPPVEYEKFGWTVNLTCR